MLAAPGEKWIGIADALARGQRNMSGGSSLAQLLAEKRGVRNRSGLPSLTVMQILEWADAHHQKTGEWPNRNSGDVPDAPGEKWQGISKAVARGVRGLSVGSTLAQLLAEKRGVRNNKSVF